MMSFDTEAMPKVLRLYLEIIQYPTLASAIRERMRHELFCRGVISPTDFEQEVRQKALASQQREGLRNPLAEESEVVWNRRLAHFRDSLTDFYFAHNLPHRLFERLVRDALARTVPAEEVVLTFNPELAPMDLLFKQGQLYESLPDEQRSRVRHHLREIIVVLTKSLISDQLGFVGLARELFTVADLDGVRRRRVGRGKIGGKAAGMLLAWKILSLPDPGGMGSLADRIVIPESYFIGADVFYDFISLNNLHYLNDQKYKPREEIETDYRQVREAFLRGQFPEEIVDGLQGILSQVGQRPLIVRSSSLLEDSFGTSFAGKYESLFCPNQGTPEQNLEDLLHAIAQVYASVFSPDALFYRQQMGLLDYDERMAILLQEVQGERHGNYFYPTLAGVAFGHNPFRWTPRIRPEDGFVRLVWGLGTRAVERVPNDYPRMVALSHPELRPEAGAAAIRRYSQHLVDAINLAENELQTKPVSALLDPELPSTRLLASVNREGDLVPLPAYDPDVTARDLVLTFDGLLSRTPFVPTMKEILHRLAAHYGRPVDVEFTAEILPGYRPQLRVHLLQCRPQASQRVADAVRVPEAVPEADVLFTADRLVPQGRVERIRHIVFVDPEAYEHIPDEATRLQLARVVGRLNQALDKKRFVLLGPGRWGSANVDLGVKVTYADIYNTAMLIEIGLAHGGSAPEASYGTHFFQDLVEAEIYPLALFPDQGEAIFNWRFFHESPNVLADLVPDCARYAEAVRLIDVPAVAEGRLLEVIMDGERSRALGYLRRYGEGE